MLKKRHNSDSNLGLQYLMNVGLTPTAGDTQAADAFLPVEHLRVLKCLMQSANTQLESHRKADAAFSDGKRIMYTQTHL